MNVTKSDLAEHIASEAGITKKKALMCLDAIAGITEQKLRAGAEVTLPGIGKLVAVQREARVGRNPRTGEAAKIDAKKAVKFKVSASLKAAIQ